MTFTSPHLQPWAPPAQLGRKVSPGTSDGLLRPWPFLTSIAPWLGWTPDCSLSFLLPLGTLPALSFTLPSSSHSCPLPSPCHPYLGILTLPALAPLRDLTRTPCPAPFLVWPIPETLTRPRPRPMCPAEAAAAGGELPAARPAGSEEPGAERGARRVPRVLLGAGARRGRGAAGVSARLLQVRAPPLPSSMGPGHQLTRQEGVGPVLSHLIGRPQNPVRRCLPISQGRMRGTEASSLLSAIQLRYSGSRACAPHHSYPGPCRALRP